MAISVDNGFPDKDIKERPVKKHRNPFAYDFGGDWEPDVRTDDNPETGGVNENDSRETGTGNHSGYREKSPEPIKRPDIAKNAASEAEEEENPAERVRKPKTDPGSVVKMLDARENERYERYIRKAYPELLIDRYFTGQNGVPGLLGTGGFGKVFRCYEKDNPKLVSAVKILIGTDKEKARREYDIQSELNDIAVVKLDGFRTLSQADGESENVIVIKMELMDGTLKDLQRQSPGQMAVPDVVDYMIEICEKVSYVHKKGITHGDIKPVNILYKIDDFYNKKTFRIGDFGLAKEQDGTVSSYAGTPEYYFDVMESGPERDVYALGITMLELFGADPRSQEFRDNRVSVDPKYNNRWELVKGLNVDKDILQICLKACYVKKGDRCTCEEMRQLLINWKQAHPVEFELRDMAASDLYRKAAELLASADTDEDQKNLAVRYLEAAGHKGSDKAYFSLFRLLRDGSVQEKQKAEEFLEKASSLGNADAKNTYAVRQIRILGPKGNPEKSQKMVNLLREASVSCSAAKYNLAILLKTGFADGQEDPEKLIAKAAAAGYGPAKAYLEKMSSYEAD